MSHVVQRWWVEAGPGRAVTLGGGWLEPDLGQVEEVGYFDVIPESGAWADEGPTVEQKPPPQAGGWIAVSDFEPWGTAVAR